MRARALAPLVALALSFAGCTDRQDGLLAVGGDAPSIVEQSRFVKRLHLDLAGELPAEEETQAALDRLEEAGDKPSTRAALADERLADPRFAAVIVSELESRIFAGGTASDTYALFCPILKDVDPACAGCPYTEDCSGCSCPQLASLAEERTRLLASADDLAAGAATIADIERRYAESQIFRFNAGSPEGVAASLFQSFVGRPAEPEEEKNVRAMFFGTFVEGSPVGLLFHRHGENYAELVDIVFDSEVYRDAAVDGVFLRYLGRSATPAERAFFAAGLAPESPDIRPVIRAVVSSAEYFAQ